MRVGEVLRRVRNRMSWWLHFQQLFARRKTTLRTGQRGLLQPAAMRVLEPRVLLSGTTELQEINVGNLRSGVSGPDPSTATGYVMYSEQSVHTRFPGMEVRQADHFIAVRLTSGNQWSYYNNETLVSFTPVATDRLVAAVNFATDTATALNGQSFVVNGIQAGYHDGDLTFTPNQYGGVYNDGEFEMTGTFFRVDEDAISVGNLRSGIAANDANEGTGYVMFSQQVVSTRFSSIDTGNADHFIMVRNNAGQWQYDTNYNWIDFTPITTDRLVASVNFSTDTILALEGQADVVNGINLGYADGDLAFTANTYNGSPNAGEFGITGSYFTVANLPPTDISLSANSLNENLPIETVVGSLSAIDPNIEAGFTYSLVSGEGSTDNAEFSISGSQLLAAASFNYEARSSYSVRVRATDVLGLWYEKVFSVDVNDLNDPPEATDDTANVVIGDSVEIDVLANDSDLEESDLTIKSISTVSSGTAEIITLEGGGQKVRYTASGGAVDEITFTYTIEDEVGLTDTATVTVAIGSYDPDPGNMLPADDLGSPDLLNGLLDGLGPHSPVVAQPLTLPEIGSVPDMVSQANVADYLLADFDVSSHGNVSSSVSGLTSTDTTTTPSTELGGTFVVDVTTITSYTRTGTENTTTGEWSYKDVFSMTYSYLTTFTHDTASLAYTLLQTGSLSYTFDAMFVDGVLTFSITDYLQIDGYLLTMTGSIEEDATPDEDNPTDWTYTNSTTVDELSAEVPDVYSGSQEITFDYSQSVERDTNDEIIDQTISQDLDVEVTDSYTIARSELWKSVSSDPEVPDSTTLLLATSTGELGWSLISSYDQVIAAGDLVSLSESFAYASGATDLSTLDLTSSLSLSSTAVVGTLLMDQPTAPQTETLTQASTFSEEVTSSVEYTFNGQRAIDATGVETYNVSYDYSDDVDGNSLEDSTGTYHSELTGDDELHILDTTSSLDETLTWGSSLDAIASNVKSTSASTNSATRTYDESMTILSSSTLTSTLSKLTAPGSTSTANESVLTDEYADSIDSTYTFHDAQTSYVASGIAYFSGLSTSHLLSDESVDMTSTTLYRPSQSSSETPTVIVTVIEEAELSTDSSTDLTVTTDYDIVVDAAENTVTTETVQTTDDVSSGVDEISLTTIVTSAGPVTGSAGTGQTESTLMSVASSNSDWEYDLHDVLTTSVTVETQETLVQTEDGEVEGVQIQMAMESTQVTTLHSMESNSDSTTLTFDSRTILATGSLADDLALVADLDALEVADIETLAEGLTFGQTGSILFSEISSLDTNSDSYTSTTDDTTTLTVEDDEITILAYDETIETFSDDDAVTTLTSTSTRVDDGSTSASSSFTSEIASKNAVAETGTNRVTIYTSSASDSFLSTGSYDQTTVTTLSDNTSTGATVLTIDIESSSSSLGTGTSSGGTLLDDVTQDAAGTIVRQETYHLTESVESGSSTSSSISTGSTTTGLDSDQDGILDEDEIVNVPAESTITENASLSSLENSTLDTYSLVKTGFLTTTSEYIASKEDATNLETSSELTITADGTLEIEQVATLSVIGFVTTTAKETSLLLDTSQDRRSGSLHQVTSRDDYEVDQTTTYTYVEDAVTGLTTEATLVEISSSSQILSGNTNTASRGTISTNGDNYSYSGFNSINSHSTAEITDWREVITDEEGQEVSEAFDTRREMLDHTIIEGEFSGHRSGNSFSHTYSDSSGRRLSEVYLGDDDYEYFYKDQTSASAYTLTSGGIEQDGRSRLHTTLEYEILDKDTEAPIFIEYSQQLYSEGLTILTIDENGNPQEGSEAGRRKVGEYDGGGAFAGMGWKTDALATPQPVGSGNNPTATGGGMVALVSGGGSSGGSGGGGGVVVTDTTPWEGKEYDQPIDVVGGEPIALPLEPKPGDGAPGVVEYVEHRTDRATIIYETMKEIDPDYYGYLRDHGLLTIPLYFDEPSWYLFWNAGQYSTIGPDGRVNGIHFDSRLSNYEVYQRIRAGIRGSGDWKQYRASFPRELAFERGDRKPLTIQYGLREDQIELAGALRRMEVRLATADEVQQVSWDDRMNNAFGPNGSFWAGLETISFSASTYKTLQSYRSPKFWSWNEFQKGTKGQFGSRSEASKAWLIYKESHGIINETLKRDPAVRKRFLKLTAEDPNSPSWMIPWLQKGIDPPGHVVDHIIPLAVGGPDIEWNMRLQGYDLHIIHHRYYHPWRP
ncbi:Ig-like domain-containing protein [Lacunimicrobium album]